MASAMLRQYLIDGPHGRVFRIQKLDADERPVFVQVDDELRGDAAGVCTLLTGVGEVQIPKPRAAVPIADFEINVSSLHHHPIPRKR